jgi:hypothetical protein
VLVHVQQLVKIGGALMFHDTWMPAVQKVLDFTNKNLKFLQQCNTRLATAAPQFTSNERSMSAFR